MSRAAEIQPSCPRHRQRPALANILEIVLMIPLAASNRSNDHFSDRFSNGQKARSRVGEVKQRCDRIHDQ
jgi:hypothetical protein